ncbi:hypothetical protein BJY18_002248 [Amycolatopsis jiangsuensis]|uniref:Uncharacterized protein n=1 Tax=Amycolatopsis jiangsuensis TaxID=1181879 RepID=A0A840ISF6_9PSEU|nr:hypothetical protein [Amycolatopsis jiangsuensis]
MVAIRYRWAGRGYRTGNGITVIDIIGENMSSKIFFLRIWHARFSRPEPGTFSRRHSGIPVRE